MKLKLLRKWFAQSFAKPIRLSAQHFAELLEVLFQENTTEEDATELMTQAGFMERKEAGAHSMLSLLMNFWDMPIEMTLMLAFF